MYKPATKTAYEWADGSTSTYRNWKNGVVPVPNTQGKEEIIMFGEDGFWTKQTAFTCSNANVCTNMHCKEDALTLEEYANVCNSKDNCEQII